MKNSFKITFLSLLFCFVFSCCFLTSCRSTIRQETQKTEAATATTNEVKETYRDTTLFAPAAETTLKIPISDLVFKGDLKSVSMPKVYHQKNGQANVKIITFHDTITVVASCDSLAIVAKIKKELQRQTSNSTRTTAAENSKTTGYTFWNLIVAFLLGFVLCYILKLFKILS